MIRELSESLIFYFKLLNIHGFKVYFESLLQVTKAYVQKLNVQIVNILRVLYVIIGDLEYVI